MSLDVGDNPKRNNEENELDFIRNYGDTPFMLGQC